MGRIRSEKLSEQSCKEKYGRALSSKPVECEQDETEQIWSPVWLIVQKKCVGVLK